MDWITDQIALGNAIEAKDRAVIEEAGIRSILSLNGEPPAESSGAERHRVFHLIDGPGNDPRHLRLAIEALKKLVREAPPVFVHCQAGRSRSPAIVAAFLAERDHDGDLDAALALVEERRDLAVADALLVSLDAVLAEGA